MRLVDEGILTKIAYSERPPRYDYRLTAKGRDLWPALPALRQWGDKYAAPDDVPVKIKHNLCGKVSHAVISCSACGAPFSYRDVRAVRGPGEVEALIPTPAG